MIPTRLSSSAIAALQLLGGSALDKTWAYYRTKYSASRCIASKVSKRSHTATVRVSRTRSAR